MSPDEHEHHTGGAEYAERVRAWAGSLRAGSTQTWRSFLVEAEPGSTDPSPAARPHPGASAALSHLDGPPARLRHSALPPHPSGAARDGGDRRIQAEPATAQVRSGGPLPGSAQLEVVRRLSAADTDLPDFAALADLVLATTGPGRGLVDVPLPWPAAAASGAPVGTPPVEPEDLPADELIRACAGVLVRLLSSLPLTGPRSSARTWRPWRRGFTLLGAPTTVGLVREALLGCGLREGGGSRTTYFVLGGPLDDLMVQRWSARVRAGAAMRWQRMWRTAAVNDRVPPGIALPTIAGHLADEFGPGRVHVVLADDPTTTLALVAEVLGVPAGPVPQRSDVLATDLLRRLNPALTLMMGEHARRQVIDQVWADVAGGEEPRSLGVPAPQLDWAVDTGERMAAALAAARARGRYAVHGEPALVVPVRRPGVRRAPDPDAVLAHALTVVDRTWRLVGSQSPGGQG